MPPVHRRTFVAVLAAAALPQVEAASAAEGWPLPPLRLPALKPGEPAVRLDALRGRPYLVNVWASWCAPCRLEHPLLLDLVRRHPDLALVGINHRDARDDALRWLAELGNPYRAVGHDPEGRAATLLKVIGPPQTLLVDRQGRMRHRHLGPLTPEALRDKLEPLLTAL
jgi:cytochrome c biogenesis protein CcmG/thiol:disulfide interchange protein DsbE